MSTSLVPTLNCTHLLNTHTQTIVWPDWCWVRTIKINAHKIKRTSEMFWGFSQYWIDYSPTSRATCTGRWCHWTSNTHAKNNKSHKFMAAEFHYAEWRIWITSIPLYTLHYTPTFDDINVPGRVVCLPELLRHHILYVHEHHLSSVSTLIILIFLFCRFLFLCVLARHYNLSHNNQWTFHIFCIDSWWRRKIKKRKENWIKNMKTANSGKSYERNERREIKVIPGTAYSFVSPPRRPRSPIHL